MMSISSGGVTLMQSRTLAESLRCSITHRASALRFTCWRALSLSIQICQLSSLFVVPCLQGVGESLQGVLIGAFKKVLFRPIFKVCEYRLRGERPNRCDSMSLTNYFLAQN